MRPSKRGAAVAEPALPGLFLRVFDDFYEDPHEVRSFALKCEFAAPFTGSWNGTHSLQCHPDTKVTFERLASYLPADGETNWDEIETSYRFWGRPSAGVFALLLAGQHDSVHAHKRTGRWAAVTYLSDPSACEGRDGLRLFRHRATGATNCIGASRAMLENFRRDGADRTAWEQVARIGMRFNRSVLFDGRYFHAASEGFGRDAATGRLTQLFAIDTREGDVSDHTRRSGTSSQG